MTQLQSVSGPNTQHDRAPSAHGQRRVRRSGHEIRARLLDAGRAVFAERGYVGASTKEIARRAEVTEVLLFRHFGSKAGLFDEAVLEPFQRFVEAYANTWARRSLTQGPTDEIAREYVDLLYGFLEAHRELFEAMLAAKAHHSSAAERWDGLFARLQDIVRAATADYGFPSRDPALTVRLTFGMAFATVIHRDMLFPSGPARSRQELVDEMTLYMMHGISHAPDNG